MVQCIQQVSLSVDTTAERGLLFIKGSVPGSKGGWLLVSDAVKIDRPADAPYPVAPRTAKVDAPVAPQVEAAPVADANEATEA